MTRTITIALAAFTAFCLPAATQSEAATGLELTATWGKIAYSSHRRHERDDLRDVLQPGPAVRTKSYDWDAFAALIPATSVEAGHVFELDFDVVKPFLAQIHPRPRAKSHMRWAAYPGVYGIVLSRTEKRVDVLLRAHVEFELTPGKVFFTVSQVEGRFVANPATRRVIGFQLAVPRRSYNYDVHIRQPDRTLIDIGCVNPLGVRGGELPETSADDPKLRDARTKLRRAFYPFARLDWKGFAEGLRAARSQGKPLHLVTIFGQLDDESC